jgi:hypothetical protein
MRVIHGALLYVLFAIGMAIGLAVGFLIFWVSLVRRARAVHAEGVVCRAEITPRDGAIGPKLAGGALVRLSGAFEGQAATAGDVLGWSMRLQKTAAIDPTVGDQDLVFGTFNSFLTAKRDAAATDDGDYLANKFSSVTPWLVPSIGPATLRLVPPPAAARDRGADRLARLDADLAADRARVVLTVNSLEVAEIRLVERLAADASALHVSMFRTGRAVRPVGVRNGMRAMIYPISQLGRRIRGG